MASSVAKTVTAYLAELPPDRRRELAAVRKLVKTSMPKGYKETMSWGMITWVIPKTTYPESHNGHPLCYAGLAAQKHHLSLYLMGCYTIPAQVTAIKEGFRRAGKRLVMGKSCIRFKKASDLPLEVLAKSIAAVPPALYILRYEEVIGTRA